MSPPDADAELRAANTLSCREATRLLSDAQERELDTGDRARLRIHLAICQACRNVEQQFDLLRHAMRRLGKDERSED
jgi:predicted anti-sigma-YlaC factor YlaD